MEWTHTHLSQKTQNPLGSSQAIQGRKATASAQQLYTATSSMHSQKGIFFIIVPQASVFSTWKKHTEAVKFLNGNDTIE